MEQWSISCKNSAGITHKVTPTGIWITYMNGNKYFFPFYETLTIAPSNVGSSLSGYFLYLIINEQLHIITLTSKTLYDDILCPDLQFIQAYFFYEEKFLIALSTSFSFVIVSVFGKKKKLTYSFLNYLEENELDQIESFEINESTRTIRLILSTRSLYFNIPIENETFQQIDDSQSSLFFYQETNEIETNQYSDLSESESDTDYSVHSELDEINEINEVKEKLIDSLSRAASFVTERNRRLLIRKQALKSNVSDYKMRLSETKKRSEAIKMRFCTLYQRISNLIQLVDTAEKTGEYMHKLDDEKRKESKIEIGNGYVAPNVLYHMSSRSHTISKAIDELIDELC
ncbi:hypothetical protein GPJ56_003574 [Histomonas meleagridis]|uniref:uncharacterized protein n=1 Tax=Histomonas meleagridis TaxID=135588 RepID=UPI00355A1272|nr:hypothetical protein GPJ56_003574 [Histomonas meleagridis]KAH0800644.1 hypothetical protein GO595_006397 [Histomonas meleagridis]